MPTETPTAKSLLARATDEQIRFLRLQFTDILGVNKNVEMPASQFEKALAGDIMFDGISHRGVRAHRGERHAARARPLDVSGASRGAIRRRRVARVICDVTMPDGTPFAGDPRGALKRAARATRRRWASR